MIELKGPQGETMMIQTLSPASIMEINNVKDLYSPVTVVIHDSGPGDGRILVECCGSAWGYHFKGLPKGPLAQFLASMDKGYIYHKLHRSRQSRAETELLVAVVSAVYVALRQQVA